MSLNIALMNAISGLQTHQRALDVTSQNVTNVNTPGYSRKTVQQQAVVLAGIGSGVEIASISRTVSEFLLKDLRNQGSLLGQSSVEDEFYQRMQDLFGSLGSDSAISTQIADLGDRFQALSVAPEDASLRIDLVNRADFLVRQFNDLATKIQDLRLQADREIDAAVDDINTELVRIEELNIRIAEHLALGDEAADLEDQRDLAVAKVAEFMNITTFKRASGDMVIMNGTGRALVDRSAATLTHDPANSFSPGVTLAAGSVDGINIGGTDITTEITSGKIAALVAMRDTNLPNLYSQLEELGRTLHDEINALHNQGTAYPGQSPLTGTRGFAATDTPVWSGNFRVAVNDSAGTLVEYQDFDLSTYGDVGALAAAINGMTNLSASFNANGNLVMTASGTNVIVLNELTSAVTVGSRTLGASEFLGLNDLFTSSANYDNYLSAQQSSATTALNLAGTLTFDGGFGTTNVNYTAGNSLTDIAAAITANATLTAAGISASVVTDGSGARLRITDSGTDNFFISDSGSLVGNLNIKARGDSLISEIAVRSDIKSDPSKIARGTLSGAATLTVGTSYIGAGDNSVTQLIANRFNAALSFDATGQLAAGTRTLSDFGGSIVSLNATQASNAADTLASRQLLFDNLNSKAASVSGVNLDEELANMVLLENAYAASARVITTTQTLFDILNGI